VVSALGGSGGAGMWMRHWDRGGGSVAGR
jgi:hypothetical protein